MKLDQAKAYILLDQSGELSSRKRRKLQRFLEVSAEARAFRADLDCITQTERIRDIPPTPEWMLARIRREALQAQPTPTRVAPLLSRHPTLAYATAVLVLAVTSAVLLQRAFKTEQTEPIAMRSAASLAWDAPLDEELSQLNDMLASIAGEDVVFDDELNGLAAELLSLEDPVI